MQQRTTEPDRQTLMQTYTQIEANLKREQQPNAEYSECSASVNSV